MGFSQDHAIGRQGRFFVEQESTFGTFVKPTATGAVRALTCNMTFNQDRKDRMDKRGTRSIQERFSGKKEVTWDMECYLLPSGAAGTPPDIHNLLLAAFGAQSGSGYTNTASTSDKYELRSEQSNHKSLSVVRHFSDNETAGNDTDGGTNGTLGVLMQACKGAWVDQWKITISGGSEPRISFSGGAQDMVHTSQGTVAGAIDTTGNTTITIDEVAAMEPGSVIAVAKVGSGEGYHNDLEISAGDLSTAAKTIPSTDMDSGNVGGDYSVADAAVVYPWIPTQTLLSDEVVSGLVGTFTFTASSGNLGPNGDGTLDSTNDSFYFTEFELSVNQNVKAHNDEALTDVVNDVTYGWREVTGSISFRARKDLCIMLGYGKNFVATDLKVVLGNSAGKTLTIDLDQVEFDTSNVEVPEAEEAIITMPFKALGDSSGEDELVLTFT